MSGIQPHPLFGHGPWAHREENKAGDMIETKFDGEVIGQRTHYKKDPYRKNFNEVRSRHRGSNGFSKERTMRHIGAIPHHLWFNWCRKYGANELHTNDKLLRKLIREHQVNVVDPRSF